MADTVVRAMRGRRKRKERNGVMVERWVGGVDGWWVGEGLGGGLMGVAASGVLNGQTEMLPALSEVYSKDLFCALSSYEQIYL